MANYSVTLYYNTGFNGVNIPDNPTLLNKCDHTTLANPVILLQDRGLNNVDLPITWNEAENCDYIKIGSWYYSVPPKGIHMLSTKTCRFDLLSDPINSMGGFTVADNGDVTVRQGFEILDGITDRCTVADDTWGKYAADDPLTAPEEPLQIETKWITPSDTSIDDDIVGNPVFIESTVNLPFQATLKDGETYTDGDGNSVTVPLIATVTDDSGMPLKTDYNVDNATVNDGTQTFIRNDKKVADDQTLSAGRMVATGLSFLRSLGQESGSIINQWTVPTAFIKAININRMSMTGENDSKDGTDQDVTLITGADATESSNISPDYYEAKNKRVLYGQYNKYGIISCSGSSMEAKPEELGDETIPNIHYKADPRPDGSVYYRFDTLNGDSDFWRNCIKGERWQNVPLVYQGASGSALTRLNYDNEKQIQDYQMQATNERAIFGGITPVARTLAGIGGIAAGIAATVGTGGAGAGVGVPLIVSGANNAISGIGGVINTVQGQSQATEMYQLQRQNELSQLYQATTIYAPTVNFPYNSSILRDVKNNGVCVYKYRYSNNDALRIDTLLTMYGYKYAQPLTISNFGHRKHFDYISCRSVSVTGLPKWWCDEIADVLKVGVRVWHELPNRAAYSDNPVRS